LLFVGGNKDRIGTHDHLGCFGKCFAGLAHRLRKEKTAAQTGGIRNKVISFLQSQGREEAFSCFDKPDQSITHTTNGQLF
jgi:hypothetical protein